MSQQINSAEQQTPRQPWDEPRIVLERKLEVRGQVRLSGGAPNDPLESNPLGSFLGPLSTSGGGVCG